MPKNEITDKIKKNLLDLHYTKYLQYYNTSIIILFTYFIGIAIAFITKQINYKSTSHIMLVVIISIIIVAIITIFMLKFREHLTNILQEVRKLKL